MARHKRKEVEEQADPEMNISSMIDCCFLLLIYFLVATSLVSEKKLDFQFPAPGDATSQNSEQPQVRHIKISGDGSITCGAEESGNCAVQIGPLQTEITPEDGNAYMEQRHLTELAEELKAYREAVTSTGQEPIVYVQAENETLQQRVIDVLAALNEAEIKTVNIKVDNK